MRARNPNSAAAYGISLRGFPKFPSVCKVQSGTKPSTPRFNFYVFLLTRVGVDKVGNSSSNYFRGIKIRVYFILFFYSLKFLFCGIFFGLRLSEIYIRCVLFCVIWRKCVCVFFLYGSSKGSKAKSWVERGGGWFGKGSCRYELF